jgi:hypothetical protein
LFLWVFWLSTTWRRIGERRYSSTAPRILDLGARWRWVMSFTTLPLYLQGKNLWCPLGGRLGGPQWTRWWRENYPAPAGTRTSDLPALSPALYHCSSLCNIIHCPYSLSPVSGTVYLDWRFMFFPQSWQAT